jgi:hypothetical protein
MIQETSLDTMQWNATFTRHLNYKACQNISYFKLSQHLPGGTDVNHDNLSQGSLAGGQYSNLKPPEYEARVLITQFSWVCGISYDVINMPELKNSAWQLSTLKPQA